MKQLLLPLLLLSAVAWLSGHFLLVMLLGVSLYLLYMLRQLLRLQHWLQEAVSDKDSLPPESRGIWGNIFDSIYRLQRNRWQAVDHLSSIISKAQESTAALEIAVVMINSKGNLEWWNLADEKLLGFQAPQDLRQAIINLIRDPLFLDYYQGQSYQMPLQLKSPLNQRQMLEFHITRFGEGEYLLLVRDITRLHKLEQMRKDFVANVSHELRTPITVITGYLETLLEDKDSVAARWQKPLAQMYQQSRRLESIIKDLLTLSRLETAAKSSDVEWVDVDALFRCVIEDAENIFADRRHRFSHQGAAGVALQGNRDELYSALSNLVFNAAKYTPPGGEVALKCYADGDSLLLEVEDNGVGIPEEHISRVTERFYRVDESRSTETGGTGLGLAIVKHTLARHSARLEIHSAPGKGSRFICRFPMAKVSKLPLPASAEQSGVTTRT